MDNDLVAAARRRILRELEKEQGGASVVNNIGGGLPVSLRDQMSQVAPSGSPEDDYYVAIRREANKKGGWDKMVRRFKAQKGEKPPTMEELFGGDA